MQKTRKTMLKSKKEKGWLEDVRLEYVSTKETTFYEKDASKKLYLKKIPESEEG